MMITNSTIAYFVVSGGKNKMEFSKEFVEKLEDVLFGGDEDRC